MSMDQEKNSSEFRNSALLAIMQNVSMSVGPEDELRRLHAENEILRAGYDAARLEIDSLQAANLELERLCEATYVAQGADAYHHACEEMERHQALRAKDGKEVGTTQSLCDGMSWLYGHIAALEAQMVAVGAGGVEPLIGSTREATSARWYMVNSDGMATLCAGREDAENTAQDAQATWPRMGPHRAVQLAEAAPQPAAQALDAQRYKFLRDGEWRDTDLEPVIRLQLNELWDAKIDAAIAAQQGGA